MFTRVYKNFFSFQDTQSYIFPKNLLILLNFLKIRTTVFLCKCLFSFQCLEKYRKITFFLEDSEGFGKKFKATMSYIFAKISNCNHLEKEINQINRTIRLLQQQFLCVIFLRQTFLTIVKTVIIF